MAGGKTAKQPKNGVAARDSNSEIDLGDLPYLAGYVLRRAQFAAFNHFLQFFADLNIRPVQYGVMSVIDKNPGLKQSQLSEALGIKRANLVAILDALEKRGLAKREAVATDRRSYALRLTDKGVALMKELRARAQQHEKLLAANIGEDGRQELLRLLHGVIEAIGPGVEDDES